MPIAAMVSALATRLGLRGDSNILTLCIALDILRRWFPVRNQESQASKTCPLNDVQSANERLWLKEVYDEPPCKVRNHETTEQRTVCVWPSAINLECQRQPREE